jgi:hypothetical protein
LAVDAHELRARDDAKLLSNAPCVNSTDANHHH